MMFKPVTEDGFMVFLRGASFKRCAHVCAHRVVGFAKKEHKKIVKIKKKSKKIAFLTFFQNAHTPKTRGDR